MTTEAGKLLLMAGLTFHSGRRFADYAELLAAIEAEARASLEAEIARLRTALDDAAFWLETEAKDPRANPVPAMRLQAQYLRAALAPEASE